MARYNSPTTKTRDRAKTFQDYVNEETLAIHEDMFKLIGYKIPLPDHVEFEISAVAHARVNNDYSGSYNPVSLESVYKAFFIWSAKLIFKENDDVRDENA